MRASALPRLFRCPASDALAQANSASVYTDAGDERHDWLSKLAMTRDASVAPAEFTEAAEEILRRLPAGETMVEAEVVGPYGVKGHYDVAIVDLARRHVTVIDWKGFEAVGPAASNEQTLLYVTALAQSLGCETATAMIVYVQPDRAPRFDVADFDVLDFADFEHRLGDLKARIATEAAKVAAGQLPDVSEGRHCKYCPAQASCPAKVQLIRRLAAGEEQRDLEQARNLSDEEAALAWERVQAIDAVVKRVKTSLYARAAQAPFRLRNGKMLGSVPHLGNERIDGDVAFAVIADQRGRAAADAAVTRHATKKAIKDALKGALAPGETLTKAEASTLAEIRRRGGAHRPTSTDVIEYDPERQLPAGGADA